MKVLFVSRSTLFSSPGGDTIQLVKTAEGLRLLGVEVDVEISGAKRDVSQYDLIHVFNMIRPADALKYFRQKHVPILLSSIYVDYSEYERVCSSNFLIRFFPRDTKEYIKAVARWIINGEKLSDLGYLFMGHRKSIRKICNETKMVLPNSNSEYFRVCCDYDVTTPCHVVPNAIDSSIFSLSSQVDPKYENAVICVARIEGRKNQLNLIKALNGAPYQVFIIGNCSPNHHRYLEACKAEAADNIHFVDHIDHEQLPNIYESAKVHVLASWFETTGLCSLEAGAMGCNLVVTDKGDQREYFDNYAEFCQPDDIDSIRRAVDIAWKRPKNMEFRHLIFQKYTWKHAAQETLHAYKSVLAGV